MVFLFMVLSFCKPEGFTQSSGYYLFGIVTTTDNHSYTGPIRWGNEEVFWTDIFNSTKTGRDYLQHLVQNNNTMLSIENKDHQELLTVQVDDAFSQIHTFECQFGDIQSIQVISNSRVDLQLKNNFVYHLKNGSNDVNTTIRVIDENSGLIKVPWDNIDRVEFLDAPADFSDRFGDPLTGTVQTTQGSFTGQIEWDQDERLTTDILNGDAEHEEMGLPFGTIRSIIKHQEGSQVVMVTGDEFLLTGSNDVDSRNRGIIVTINGLGRIKIPWEAFIRVIFDKDVVYAGPGYNDFPEPETLKGTVFDKNDQIFWGAIVYDLDEAFDTEFLQGKSEEIEYQIPFWNIRSVTPMDDESSGVLLKNGEKLILSNMQDVSHRNEGILIFEDISSIIKIDWGEVMEVQFK